MPELLKGRPRYLGSPSLDYLLERVAKAIPADRFHFAHAYSIFVLRASDFHLDESDPLMQSIMDNLDRVAAMGLLGT